MAIYTSNLSLTTDSDFSQIFTLENAETNSPTNLTGFTVASSIRKHPAAKKGEGFEATIVTDSASERTKVLEGTVLVNIGITKIPRDIVYPPT